MPKLDNFDQVDESTAKQFSTMEPGVYMCRVQAIRTEGEDSRGNRWDSARKQYVQVVVDVDEGEHAGKFSDDYWSGQDKDYGHRFFMSWKESARGMLKHTLRAFDEANPGFDSLAAFEADKWELFVGKRVLVQWNGQEYESNTGEVRMRVRPDRAVTEDDDAKAKVEKLDGAKVDAAGYMAAAAEPDGHAASANGLSDLYSESIPF